MSTPFREFGTKLPGINYVDRPGAYAFLKDANGRLGIIQTGAGLFLPGGGMDPGEDAISGLRRELYEEIGYTLVSAIPKGQAAQYHWSAFYSEYFRKIGTFFDVVATAPAQSQFQDEHELIWLDRAQAAVKLTQEFQRWAVTDLS